ncbi:LOW QUALITY PROTEIN: MPP10 U3 small nucleolar RNA-associated protein MPP10 [Candida maltosa Xu316]
MSQDILQLLQDKPQDVFKLKEKNNNYFNSLAKSFIDPLAKQYSVLDEIYIDGLDSIQVYGQTKMVLDGVGEQLLGEKIPSIMERLEEEDDEEDEDEEENEEENEEEENKEEFEEENEGFEGFEEDDVEGSEEDDEEAEEPEDVEEGSDAETLINDTHTKDAFGLNDGFFDIDHFNKQILSMEKDNNINDEDEEEIDYFGKSDDEEDEMDYYDDFYDKPGQFKQKVSHNSQDGDEDDEDDEGEEVFNEDDYDNAVGSAMLDLFAEDDKETKPKSAENLSTFEKQQRSIQAEIAKLEAELVADKKWTMKGEITSNDRPQESLLDETDLTFDRTAKPVPVITEESTQTLEDLIRKRIKEDDFNDLPRRIITDISRFHKAPKAEVSEQKSSKSLAELYEDEYNQIDAQQESLNEEVKKQHDEISELFTKVTHKLDALCSAHFIPKPHQLKTIDIKVTDSSSPAISMEDAQPLHVSSESRLAPQEIYKIGDDVVKGDGVKGKSQVQLKSGLSYSKDELSREDKQRLRRAGKRKKTKEFKDREENKRQKNLQNTKGKNTKNNNNNNNNVVDALSNAKNITVIGQKGEMRDIKGNLKKSQGPQSSNSFKL